MKNICILKGWFNMEKFKNGAISEEALDEIAGGLSISKSTVKNVLIAAGIGVLAAGAGVTGTLGVQEYNRMQKQKGDRAKYAARHNRKYMREQNDINNIDGDYFAYESQKKGPVKIEGEEHPANMVEDMLYPQW